MSDPLDTATLRKARGAFFTPSKIAQFITDWAVRSPTDRVLEPSAGDAEFLVHAVARLRHLGVQAPIVHGVEMHSLSAASGAARVAAAAGRVDMTVGDFFDTPAGGDYTAVVGLHRSWRSNVSPNRIQVPRPEAMVASPSRKESRPVPHLHER